MVIMNRVQKQAIIDDLAKKMVFIVGPRQSGKTWLAKHIAEDFNQSVYLNYDNTAHREQIVQQDWRETTELLVLDELHKMPEWKNYLKGLYDTKPDGLKILVTGSARLEAFRQAGDSLAGRYFVHHLLPFSLAELHQLQEPINMDRLMTRSGFPEPYCADSDVDAKRWRQEYLNSLIAVDVLDFDNIQNLRAMKMTLDLLRRRVGSPISYTSIAEDVAVSSVTVKKYIDVLESLYIVFRVTPHSKNIARSILKEPKIYFFDTGLVEGDEGAQFENLVAVSLMKECLAKRDYLAEDYRLHYVRTKDGKKVDFSLVRDDTVERLIEVKLSNKNIDKNLYDFCKKYSLPGWQVVKELSLEKRVESIDLVKAGLFLEERYL